MALIYCNTHKRYDTDACSVCEGENPTYEREFRAVVVLRKSWLTNGDVGEATGWKQVESDLTEYLKKYRPRYADSDVYLEFIEFDGTPVVTK